MEGIGMAGDSGSGYGRALEHLLPFTKDEEAVRRFAAIKADNKRALASWLNRTQGTVVNPSALFAILSKRLHEYKRQQLNLLYLIHLLFKTPTYFLHSPYLHQLLLYYMVLFTLLEY